MKGLRRPLRTLRSQVGLLVGGLLVLLVVSAVSTLLAERQVRSTQVYLSTVLRPAQVAVAMLGEAYVDQETGARGYQLTGHPAFLQPYNAGLERAARLRLRLNQELASDPLSRQLLKSADDAATNWHRQAALPEIQHPQTAAPSGALLEQALTGKRLFDTLRGRMSSLAARVNQLAAAKAAAIDSAEAVAKWLSVAAGLLGLFLVLVAFLVLRNSLSRPLSRLVAHVQRVADGDLDHSVDVRGPQELSTVARAVETMRVRILSQATRAVEMQHQLNLAQESERIASGLHDVVIGRLSRIGLILQSTAGRHPAVARVLSDAVGEIDSTIRELRGVIFGLKARRAGGDGLRARVLTLISECEPDLGFTPGLHFEGIPAANVSERAVDELIAALRESLSDMARRAREAEIKVSMANGVLRLQVADKQDMGGDTEPSTLAGVTERAETLGGTCTVGRTASGTVIDWKVPAIGTAGPSSA